MHKRDILSSFVFFILLFQLVPGVFAVSIGSGLSPIIETEDFSPRIWMCQTRTIVDDATEPGRISLDGQIVRERINNYAFEGEQIVWTVLVMDKNGIEKIRDVYATIGNPQGEGNDIEANCFKDNFEPTNIFPSCNARIDEERITQFDRDTMAFFNCYLTVETAESMYGEYWITVEVEDLDGNIASIDENEYWFLNPVIALTVNGELTFESARPGTSIYSNSILVGNDADAGSGVLLDMFITGTDFYDSSSSGAKCPTSNQLELSNFRYFAANGGYSTANDLEEDFVDGDRDKDAEGYVNIEYGFGFNNPGNFYNNAEIIQAAKGQFISPVYYAANILSPGSDFALTFKLNLPEPCNGNFDSGQIFFWGEAI